MQINLMVYLMLLMCKESVVLLLQIIFSNILPTRVYSDVWKHANLTPVFKKNNKQLKNNRPISLLPICGKIVEKIIFKHMYNHLNYLSIL